MNRKHKTCRACKRGCCEDDEAHEDGRLIRWTYEVDAKVDPDLDMLICSGCLDWYCNKVPPRFNVDYLCLFCLLGREVFNALLSIRLSLRSRIFRSKIRP